MSPLWWLIALVAVWAYSLRHEDIYAGPEDEEPEHPACEKCGSSLVGPGRCLEYGARL